MESIADSDLHIKLWDDPKYRTFAGYVEKALRSFESTTEWADLITAMGKLNKVLQNNTKFRCLPKKVTISKRLAQCLHPALPGGVHLKAIEVYDTIFKTISPNILVQDMFIYSSGLFPTMSFAAMNVKPRLLQLYEEHIVPLGLSIRPALSGLLVGLLPGLEEGSEYSQRTNDLLEALCRGVDAIFFYGCLWKCVLYNPGIRLQAITYVLSHLKKKSMEDQIHMMGTDINIMVEALGQGINDSSVYVQRSFFDFMISAFPLHNSLLTHQDLIKILMATLNVVLRRDMSLNRRLYAWLLGGNGDELSVTKDTAAPSSDTVQVDAEDETDVHNQYFDQYSKQPLLEALRRTFKETRKLSKPDLRPYRILMCLIDKPEIGTAILEDVLLDILRCLKNQCFTGEHQRLATNNCVNTETNRKQTLTLNKELIKTFNLLVGTFEPNLLWEFLGNLFKNLMVEKQSTSVKQVDIKGCQLDVKEYQSLLSLLIDILSLDTQPQTRTVYLPNLLLGIIDQLRLHTRLLCVGDIQQVVTLCCKVLSHILPSKNFVRSISTGSHLSTTVSDSSQPNSPVNDLQMDTLVFRSSSEVMQQCITSFQEFFASYVKMTVLRPRDHTEAKGEVCKSFDLACKLLVDFCSFTVYEMDSAPPHSRPTVPPVPSSWATVLVLSSQSPECSLLQTAISTLLEIISMTQAQAVANISPLLLDLNAVDSSGCNIYQKMADCLWRHIGEPVSNCHDQNITDLFVQLHQLTPSPWVCESVIISDFTSDKQHIHFAAYRKFATLWHLSRETKLKVGAIPHGPRKLDRALLFMLDGLRHRDSASYSLVSEWLLQSVHRGDLTYIIEPLILLLLHTDTARISIQHMSLKRSPSAPPEDAMSESGSEDKIYGISSDQRGNIMYHVHEQDREKSVSDGLRTTALTSIKDEYSYTSGALTAVHQGEIELACDEVSHENVNLLVNPFGSDTSLDQAISAGYVPTISNPASISKNAKRLNAKVCRKEGIYFNQDGFSSESEEDSVESCRSLPNGKEDDVGNIVRSIIDDILHAVSQHIENIIDPVESMLEQREHFLTANGVRFVRASSVDGISTAVDVPSDLESSTMETPDTTPKTVPGSLTTHPWHAHILLYSYKYDCERVYYALQCILDMVTAHPVEITQSLSSTTLASKDSTHLALIQELLTRHRKAILGKNFYGTPSSDAQSSFRSTTYLEILVTYCLYYMRSYFPEVVVKHLPAEVMQFNKHIHTICTDVLSSLLLNIRKLLPKRSESFTDYIMDVLVRTKIQKLLIHFLTVHLYNKTKNQRQSLVVSDVIIKCNADTVSQELELHYGKKLMYFLKNLVLLENVLVEKGAMEGLGREQLKKALSVWGSGRESQMSYTTKAPILHQEMFITLMIDAMKQQQDRAIHTVWLDFFTFSLPYFLDALPHIILPVVQQMCKNLELVAANYGQVSFNDCRDLAITQTNCSPIDYGVGLLENLAKIWHFCVLEPGLVARDRKASASSSKTSIAKSISGASIDNEEGGDNTTILTNIRYLFTASNREPSPGKDVDPCPHISQSRKVILQHMQFFLQSLTSLWKAICRSEKQVSCHPAWTMGSTKAMKSSILELIGPLSVNNTTDLLTAMANTWMILKVQKNNKHQIIPIPNENQMYLVDLLCALRVMPADSLIQSVAYILRNKQGTGSVKLQDTVQVNIIELMYSYLENHTPGQLRTQWSTLLTFLRDGLQINLTGSGQLMLLGIMNMYVQKVSSFDLKKEKRDLQDISQKLVELAFNMAGSTLEQTAWFGKSLQVKDNVEFLPEDNPSPGIKMDTGSISVLQSTQALNLLAEVLAPLLDTVYGSGEKDKITTLLTRVIHNVFPYLKHHSKANLTNFRPASCILASISGYPYTRKAWKKEAFDVFLGSDFFKMDEGSIRSWRAVVDNLMTHDRTTFKELIGKVPVPGGGTLNLFSTKDAEFELRAQLIKRLTFTVFCSEKDQYEKMIPSIQACLADNLRLSQSPLVQTEIFYCFRVLLWKMSPRNLMSLWPTIVSELVQILLQIEQQLVEVDNSLDYTREDHSWLQLYLAACKLLDLTLILPADLQPQFQLYHWAFAGDIHSCEEGLQTRSHDKFPIMYVPHVTRIASAMSKKFGRRQMSLVIDSEFPLRLTSRTIWSIKELAPFFNTVVMETSLGKKTDTSSALFLSGIEAVIEQDFLEYTYS